MNEHGKSDSSVVPAKPPNKAGRPAAEVVEGRELAKGNTDDPTRPGHRAGDGVPSGLDRVREVARRDKDARFTALLHHVNLASPVVAYEAITAPGRGGCGRGDVGAYGTGPGGKPPGPARAGCTAAPTGRSRLAGRTSRRRTGGSGRSASPALEDKIVQRAVVEVLNAIYEEDFLGFSYGFRPGRSPHDALDALAVGI